MNYFELFGLPLAPSVDKSTIAKTYFELQKKYHPDFYTNATDNEKEDVLQQSADVNKAFKTFQDPDRTLAYFLQVTGLIVKDEKYELPPDFLMEMMDINETLTDNKESARKQVAGYQEKLWEDTKHIILNYHVGTTDGTDLQKLKAYYYKKKYLQRILDRLDD